MELTHTATRAGRLSSFLKEEMRLSTGLMNKLKWGDAIRVNGRPEHTDFAVRPGDRISVRLEEEDPAYPAQDGPLTILYEDEHLLAVDKPAGMLIHPSRSRNEDTLANFVIGYYRRTGQPSAFHPITRLDRDTFGVVLLAKNAYGHALLQQTPMEKVYHARTLGGPLQDRGTIRAPIARKPLPSLLREIRPDGKDSITEFTVLERTDVLCKLALTPVTGRTHQLRLHCAHMGFPILGDPQYGTPECMNFGWTSQALCAKHLSFLHPITGEPITVTSRLDV
ncbi:MAG: RluA family pseudouridine synthase [Ruminococcaceae bacterium]|nr:RluA family pseudouridine synthase [Oscillospiraceae bacterium]